MEEVRPPASTKARRRPSSSLLVRLESAEYDFPVSNEERFEVNQPDVVDESVDGEVLIVHLGTGTYFSARDAGDAAWQLLASGQTPAECAVVLGQSDADVQAFVARLIDEGLLRPRSRPVDPPPAIQPISGPLMLDKYTDMQELLLLDPIHDVEQEGWPVARGNTPEGRL